jgi:hypothetical protein
LWVTTTKWASQLCCGSGRKPARLAGKTVN